MGSNPSKKQSPIYHGSGNVHGATDPNIADDKRRNPEEHTIVDERKNADEHPNGREWKNTEEHLKDVKRKNTEEHPKNGKRKNTEEHPKAQTGSVSETNEHQTPTPRDGSENREETEMRQQKEEDRIQREHEQLKKERIGELKKCVNKSMKGIMQWKKERVGSNVQVINLSRTLQQFCIRNQLCEELEVVQVDPGILNRLRDKRAEKVKLLHKLSEIAGTRLKHNNPNLADLSDENRPTKLVERLSELYDNIWTDIFEKVRDKVPMKVDDKEIFLNLRDILKKCYEECKRNASSQRQSLCQKLAGPSTDYEDPSLLANVNDFQKKTVEHTLKTLNTKLKQLVRESNINPTCQVLKVNDPDYIAYVEGCTELAWHTQIQSPPLVFEFDSKNKDWFKKFTSAGQIIDYVVWPAVFLHEDGPLLTKGIAQYVKTSNADESVRTQVFQLENETQGQVQTSAATAISSATSSDNKTSVSDANGKGLHVSLAEEKQKEAETRSQKKMDLDGANTNKPTANKPIPIGTNVNRGKMHKLKTYKK